MSDNEAEALIILVLHDLKIYRKTSGNRKRGDIMTKGYERAELEMIEVRGKLRVKSGL